MIEATAVTKHLVIAYCNKLAFVKSNVSYHSVKALISHSTLRLCILDNSNPVISVEGFADYTDVSVEDLVPWTPLKTG